MALAVLLRAAVAALALHAALARTAVQFGPDIPAVAQKNVLKHLLAVDSTVYNTTSPTFSCSGFSLCLSFGNTPIVGAIINSSVQATLVDQAFAFQAANVNGTSVVVATGAPVDPTAWFKASVAIGPLYGMYAALEAMGFAFTHPLSPIYPLSLRAPAPMSAPAVHHFGWPIRSWHYHTEHPLDLQEVLNGFDAGSVAALKATPGTQPQQQEGVALQQLPAELLGGSKGGVRGAGGGLDSASIAARRAAVAGAVSTLHSTAQAVAAGNGGAVLSAGARLGGAGGGYNQTWESMLPEVDSFFEWLVANRQNRLEYILLYYQGWDAFATGAVRRQRLGQLVDMAHQWGLLLGIDNAIALIQQHSWYMTGSNGTLATQQASIASHLDWFMSLGYDYLSTESGTTEFSHPNDVEMLSWMNFTAAYMNTTWNSRTYIKCHCSSDQTCEHYVDPRTGKPLNFNFLPMYADSRMGVMPHTVQVYDIVNDPAPTYGNSNFTYMADFLLYMAQVNKDNAQPGAFEREIVFHGETAYWVNYDINVPLFLPLYGQRRWVDYAFLAQQEHTRQVSMHGTNNFESGWVYGYWLSNVAAARAAGAAAGELAGQAGSQTGTELEGSQQWLSTVSSVAHAMFDAPSAREAFLVALHEYVMDQAALLIHGDVGGLHRGGVGGNTPHTGALRSVCGGNISYCNGMAYMAGKDATIDLTSMFNQPPNSGTQPNYVSLWDVAQGRLGTVHKNWQLPTWAQLSALLAATNASMSEHTENIAGMRGAVVQSPSALAAFDDIVDSMRLTALRAAQVSAVYSAVQPGASAGAAAAALAAARGAIEQGAVIVARREASGFHVPLQRIAGWYENPTVYGFGFVWTAHSLYYWWRDWGIAQYIVQPPAKADVRRESPCYLNIENPADVGFGSPPLNALSAALRAELGDKKGWDAIADCLWQPPQELQFPQDIAG